MRKLCKRYAFGITALMLALTSGSAFAQCDFLTSGGFIFFNDNLATFGAGGGCMDGGPFSGHLEYVDHGLGLNVHGTSITGYTAIDSGADANGHPTGARLLCGTARTNLFGDVDFAVRARDKDEPGVNDQFDIRLTQGGVAVYDTQTQCPAPSQHFLGSPSPCAPGDGGGNVQLHTPLPNNTGSFGGTCPAAETPA